MKEDKDANFWKELFGTPSNTKPEKRTHNKCPVCRKIHGKKTKGSRNTACDSCCPLRYLFG